MDAIISAIPAQTSSHRVALRAVWPIFLVSRLWLVAATVVAAHLTLPAVLSRPTSDPFWQTWRRWDADIYAHIATVGYVPSEAHTTPAFFPLFPLLAHLVAPLFDGNTYLAGLLITNVAWLVALVELYQLAQRDFGATTARGAVLAMTVFPAAFFGFVPYPEALFLALAIAAMRQIRRHHWASAALLGGLAALTRQAGLLLILPYLCEWAQGLREHESHEKDTKSTKKEEEQARGDRVYRKFPALFKTFRVISRSALAPSCPSCSRLIPLALVVLIPAGTALYALWLWHAVGDPLAFLHAEATWHRGHAWPWQTIALGVQALATQPSKYFTFRAWQELLTVLAMGALAVLAVVRRIPATYLVFALPLYLLFLMQIDPEWPLLSQSRFMLEIFPLSIVLGDVVAHQRWRQVVLIAACVPLQMILLGVFSRGGWVL